MSKQLGKPCLRGLNFHQQMCVTQFSERKKKSLHDNLKNTKTASTNAKEPKLMTV